MSLFLFKSESTFTLCGFVSLQWTVEVKFCFITYFHNNSTNILSMYSQYNWSQGGTRSIQDGGIWRSFILQTQKNTRASEMLEPKKYLALKFPTQKQAYKCTLYCLLNINSFSVTLRWKKFEWIFFWSTDRNENPKRKVCLEVRPKKKTRIFLRSKKYMTDLVTQKNTERVNCHPNTYVGPPIMYTSSTPPPPPPPPPPGQLIFLEWRVQNLGQNSQVIRDLQYKR